MAFDGKQLREHIIVPALKAMEPHIPFTEEAVDLLCMTAAHESLNGTYLKQVNGPALGIYQMEPFTLHCLYKDYLNFRRPLLMLAEAAKNPSQTREQALVSDLMYATTMARLHYWRVPHALPKKASTDYLTRLALYAKMHYNTVEGKATPAAYLNDFLKFYK